MMRVLLVGTLLLACAGNPPVETAEPLLMPPAASCVDTPPPQPAVWLSGTDEGCPAPWAGCLDATQLIALAGYLSRIQIWANRAWTSCGPTTHPVQ
jgi:hypothetical protein